MRKIIPVWLCAILMFSSTIVGINVNNEVVDNTNPAAVILNDPNLVGEWLFDEGVGEFANDTSGNNNNGTLMPSYPGNVPDWVNGINGTALDFDGTDDYVSVQDDISLDIADEITIAAWLKPSGANWQYKKPITISNPGALLTDYQVNLTVDYVPGNMNPDFSDLRFYDSNGDKLTAWVESQTTGSMANVWVEVPTIPPGDSIINIYYGNPAANHETIWSGTFTLPSTTIPPGWFYNSTLEGRFPRGNSTYGGTGGDVSHEHTYSGTTSVPSSTSDVGPIEIDWQSFQSTTHTHDFSGTTALSFHMPPYLDVIYSSNSVIPLNLDAGCIAIFDTASLPMGWSQFTDLNNLNYFPRGNSVYGATGGSATHDHFFAGTTSVGSDLFSEWSWALFDHVPVGLHTHSYSGTTTATSSLPPYLDVIYAQSGATSRLPYGMIAMFDSLPPMGWSYFSQLDERFPRGSTSYGGSGGNESHVHSYSGTIGITSATQFATSGVGYSIAELFHTHSISFTTESASNLPPYLDVIFAKRNSMSVGVSFGNETANGISKTGAYSIGAIQNTAVATINNQTISTVTPSGWNYIVQTYNGTTQCLYVNSILLAVQPLSGPIDTNSHDLIMGEFFTGIIDEVSIWDRALNATEIEDIFRQFGFAPHFPIRINSNADFDEAHGVVNWATGNGSAGNPWIIENYDINGTGYGYCIYIGNTTEHFIMRNCTLHNANGNSARYYWDSGLVLFKVQNGTIDSNNISSNERDGIYFGVGCRNNTIVGNNVTLNTVNGIHFAQSGIRKITENTFYDYCPQINDNSEVVWWGGGGVNTEIFFWDGVTTTQITLSLADDEYPQINDNGEVVWQCNEGSGWEIFYWDGVTTTGITENNENDRFPQINNNGEVVWEGRDGNDYEIFFWNGTTTTQVTNNTYDDQNPQINNNSEVVWQGLNGTGWEIFFWDGVTTTQITNNTYWDRNPQINDNGEVVWFGSDGLDMEIFFWDGATTTQITNNTLGDGNPQINDNGEVVWYCWDGNDYEIFFWDGVGITQVTNNSENDRHHQINDNGDVVWTGYDGNDYEIFFWDGATTTQVTNNLYNDWDCQINNFGDVVWNGSDGIDFEIFFWYGQLPTQNTISDNYIALNTNSGIHFSRNGTENTITNNTISFNNYGIFLSNSTDNMIYHNNIIGNTNQAWDNTGTNFWNDTYPVGGNYWSDYSGVDFNCTPTQDMPPPDGIGDTPYNIFGGAGAQDNYPLMSSCDELDIYPPDHYNEFPAPGSTIDDLTPTISVIVVDTSGIDTNTIRLYVNSFPVFYSLDPFATGYNASYWHGSGFSDGEVVTCRIVAEDIYGNELDFTWDFTADVVEIVPPEHSNEYPPINGNSLNCTPVISVHVTDPSGVEPSTIRFYIQGFSVFYTLTPITDGYNVSYYYETGFTPGEVVTCNIIAEDVYGNLLDFTWEFTVQYAFSKSLVSGWNFISISVIPNGTVFDSISGKWDYIQYYDASNTTDHWKTYSIYKPPSLNDLWSLSLHWGFWLHTTEACTWYLNGTLLGPTDIQLYAGWNMVGYPTFTEKSIAEALAGTGYDRPVEGFNASAPYRLGPLADTYMMKPGEGYWVHVPADTVWVVDW